MYRWKHVIVTLVLLTLVAMPAGQSRSQAASAGVAQATVSAAAIRAAAYVNESYGVPATSLLVVTNHALAYPALQRHIQVVGLVDIRPGGQGYKVLVDPTSGRTTEDTTALAIAEAQALRRRIGKLSPDLQQRLQQITDQDQVPVGVWLAPQPGQTLADLQQVAFALVAAKYPEARTALALTGIPMAVDDPQRAKQIEADYNALLNAAMEVRTAAVVAELRRQGFTVTTYQGMPTFAATLPKSIILNLGQLDIVGSIDLIDAQEAPDLDSTGPTHRVPYVWSRGITGRGVIIAIQEQDNVDRSNRYLNHAAVVRPGGAGVQSHATTVASVAASFYNPYKGMAHGATIMSAGAAQSNVADTVSAVQWAIDNGAAIVNRSASFFGASDCTIQYSDRAFDYKARQNFRLITKSAGNTGPDGCVTSPGRGWNVLTVGSFADNDNPNWVDDTMANSSSFLNPTGGAEKPEVVAVGECVTALALNNTLSTGCGTSLATPQIAGLAALLIQQDTTLTNLPHVLKAIIMASAIHNIEGPPTPIPGADHRDGAGAIQADLAHLLSMRRGGATTCQFPCWWAESTNNFNNRMLSRSFEAVGGERVRVAISWFSNADSSGSSDVLDTDFDLYVRDPNQQLVQAILANLSGPPVSGPPTPGLPIRVAPTQPPPPYPPIDPTEAVRDVVATATGMTANNNYEVVEFVAPQTGTYTIELTHNGAPNLVGIATTRTYPFEIPYIDPTLPPGSPCIHPFPDPICIEPPNPAP